MVSPDENEVVNRKICKQDRALQAKLVFANITEMQRIPHQSHNIGFLLFYGER